MRACVFPRQNTFLSTCHTTRAVNAFVAAVAAVFRKISALVFLPRRHADEEGPPQGPQLSRTTAKRKMHFTTVHPLQLLDSSAGRATKAYMFYTKMRRELKKKVCVTGEVVKSASCPVAMMCLHPAQWTHLPAAPFWANQRSVVPLIIFEKGRKITASECTQSEEVSANFEWRYQRPDEPFWLQPGRAVPRFPGDNAFYFRPWISAVLCAPGPAFATVTPVTLLNSSIIFSHFGTSSRNLAQKS